MRHLILGLLLFSTSQLAHAGSYQEDSQRGNKLRGEWSGAVLNRKIENPKWSRGSTRLSFRKRLPDGKREKLTFDTESGKIALPSDKEKEHKAEEPKGEPAEDREKKFLLGQRPRLRMPGPSERSPDKKFRLTEKESGDLILVSGDSDDEDKKQLTDDSNPSARYQKRAYWSSDGKWLATIRGHKPQEHRVHMVESSPKDQKQPRLHSHNYLKPGDKIAKPVPYIFEVASGKKVEFDHSLFDEPWSMRHFHWSKDGKEFRFVYNARGHQALRLIGINPATGKVRAIIDERSETFIDYSQKQFIHLTPHNEEAIWSSERDGWHHLYLYDTATGKVKNQITSGSWVVRRVEGIDVGRRELHISVMGIYPDQDPYHEHLARVSFDGGKPTMLTEGDGTHEIQFSPGGKFFIDSYSRVDLAPVHELRRTSDGKLVCELLRCDDAPLRALGWRPPQRFVAKGRDGKADIHGIIVRPSQFDQSKKYPVIEKIYAGPHGHFVPKKFAPGLHTQTFAEHGFIMVQIDGMGTNFRSKAFHDVCWQNLMDSGFPDRIAWMKAAAEKHPELDLERVGIFGGSAGGQSTLAGMLNHPEFYKVGVSDCGCHDNRMDKIWWNEAWMGKVGPHYDANSNVTHAHKLRGELLLTVGELDRNVDPASTMQVVDALIRADRDFDMFVVPGGGHGIGESRYLARRRVQFFREHLLGSKD